MSPDIASDYRGERWADGPGPVYERLAGAVVALAPAALAGSRVLDLGAGTGAASGVLLSEGARVTAADLAVDMLAYDRVRRPPAVAADALALPFTAGAFDGVVAAFSLTHVSPPVEGLAEARRVTKADGWLVVSSFAEGDRHPAKAVVDELMRREGWTPPAWYEFLKREVEPMFADAARFAALAGVAGLREIEVQHFSTEAGLSSTEAAVKYRMGMAQYGDFMQTLEPSTQARLAAQAVELVGDVQGVWAFDLVVLVGRA